MIDLEKIGIMGEVPTTFGDLETALGVVLVDGDLVNGKGLGVIAPDRALSDDILGLSARYVWDMFHEQMPKTVAELRWRGVTCFTLHLARGRSVIARALYERFGGPRLARGSLVYGQWILEPLDPASDACKVSYQTELPDWAVAPADAAVRRRVLLQIKEAAITGVTLDEAAHLARTAPPEGGLVCKEATSNRVRLELTPPMAALELAELFGWQPAFGECADMHMTAWFLKVLERHGSEEGAYVPSLGHWPVRARLDGRPTGGEVLVPSPSIPPELVGVPGRVGMFGRHALGPGDMVRQLSLG